MMCYECFRLDLRFGADRFCPGALGFPFRGDLSFAIRTNSSSRAFGTARMARMTSLKCWNSGVESNGAAFILSPSVSGFVSRVPGAYGKEVSSSIAPRLACQLFVCDPATYDLLHDHSEPLCIGELPIVK